MFLYISKIFTIIASGIGISFSLVSFFLYRNTSSEKLVSPTEIQMYMRKYNIYDIQNLPQDNHNDNDDYDIYVFQDDTPVGKVIMKYNCHREWFEYYCDRFISNKFLEEVCKGFILKFKCKQLYVDYYYELSQRKEILEKFKEQEELKQAEQDLLEEEQKDNVFVKLKSYNKKRSDSFFSNTDILIKKNYNKFKYMGKINDYMATLSSNDTKNTESFEVISYEQFKQKQC